MIIVDTSKIPPDKLNHPKLAPLKNQMELALNHRKWMNSFCIHEAGHQIYLYKLGVTKFEHEGPRIEYSATKDDPIKEGGHHSCQLDYPFPLAGELSM
jgi:hypothetical protein